MTTCCSTYRPHVPCPCQEDYSAFLPDGLPIPAGGVRPAFSTPTGVFQLAPNSVAISTIEELLTYLNSTVIQQLLNSGHSVEGQFTILNNKIIVPRVDGACAIVALRRRGT